MQVSQMTLKLAISSRDRDLERGTRGDGARIASQSTLG